MNSHIYLAILSVVLSCRLSFTNAQFRMRNGKDIDIRDSPHTVAIFILSQYQCVGSLVTLKSVVTVAHSVFEIPCSHIVVLGGVSDIRELNKGGQQRKVQSIIYGDGFTSASIYMDIAVVKLEGPFNSGETVEPVGLCECRLIPGIPMEVSGWGSLTYKNPKVQHLLKTCKMPIVRKDECQYIYNTATPPFSLPETIICAGCTGSNTCLGDSGAGVIVRNKLCAVVYGGIDDGDIEDTNYPDLFTDVTNTKVMDFLKRNINFNE